jgi:hypothetical protein
MNLLFQRSLSLSLSAGWQWPIGGHRQDEAAATSDGTGKGRIICSRWSDGDVGRVGTGRVCQAPPGSVRLVVVRAQDTNVNTVKNQLH